MKNKDESTCCKAIISILPKYAGGRENPIFSGYKPNLIFGIDISNLNNYWVKEFGYYGTNYNEPYKNADAIILFEYKCIYPGEAKIVDLNISEIASKYLGDNLLRGGINFFLSEGTRIVGTGEIL